MIAVLLMSRRNYTYTNLTKHVDILLHSVREKVANDGTFRIMQHVESRKQAADGSNMISLILKLDLIILEARTFLGISYYENPEYSWNITLP